MSSIPYIIERQIDCSAKESQSYSNDATNDGTVFPMLCSWQPDTYLLIFYLTNLDLENKITISLIAETSNTYKKEKCYKFISEVITLPLH